MHPLHHLKARICKLWFRRTGYLAMIFTLAEGLDRVSRPFVEKTGLIKKDPSKDIQALSEEFIRKKDEILKNIDQAIKEGMSWDFRTPHCSLPDSPLRLARSSSRSTTSCLGPAGSQRAAGGHDSCGMGTDDVVGRKILSETHRPVRGWRGQSVDHRAPLQTQATGRCGDGCSSDALLSAT